MNRMSFLCINISIIQTLICSYFKIWLNKTKKRKMKKIDWSTKNFQKPQKFKCIQVLTHVSLFHGSGNINFLMAWKEVLKSQMLYRIGYKQILFRLDDTLNVFLMPISIDSVCHICHIQTILLILQPLYSRFPYLQNTEFHWMIIHLVY